MFFRLCFYSWGQSKTQTLFRVALYDTGLFCVHFDHSYVLVFGRWCIFSMFSSRFAVCFVSAAARGQTWRWLSRTVWPPWICSSETTLRRRRRGSDAGRSTTCVTTCYGCCSRRPLTFRVFSVTFTVQNNSYLSDIGPLSETSLVLVPLPLRQLSADWLPLSNRGFEQQVGGASVQTDSSPKSELLPHYLKLWPCFFMSVQELIKRYEGHKCELRDHSEDS